MTHLSPIKARRLGGSKDNVDGQGRNSKRGNKDATLDSYYKFSNVSNLLKRKISRRSSIEELVERNVLKSPNLGRIDGRASTVELQLRKAKLAKALAKRMLEVEVKPYRTNTTGLVEKRKSLLETLYVPRSPRADGALPPPSGDQGEYAKQRSNIHNQGLDVDPVSGGSVGVDSWKKEENILAHEAANAKRNLAIGDLWTPLSCRNHKSAMHREESVYKSKIKRCTKKCIYIFAYQFFFILQFLAFNSRPATNTRSTSTLPVLV